jgi:drug/metabolite transporter (DMT)-like permease
MCFSENQSYFNAFLLGCAGIYKISNPKVGFAGLFFAIKELLQGLLYKYHYKNDKDMKRLLATISYVHLCFQPFVFSIFYSNFDPNPKLFNWNIIFIITLILGILMTTTLHELNIENDPDCIPDSINDDFCNEETGAYMGRYHIAYKFKTDKEWEPISRWNYWMFLFFVPVLFTKAYPLGIAFVTACVLIFGIYDYLNDIEGIPGIGSEYSGEKAAIWCFLSFGFIPVIIFENEIKKYLK